MKKHIAILVVAILAETSAFSQTYQCEATTAAGLTYKLSTQIDVTDSTVVFTTNGNEMKAKRVNSSTGIYFTDGVVTTSIIPSAISGKVRGFTYTTTLAIQSITNQNQPVSVLYCNKR